MGSVIADSATTTADGGALKLDSIPIVDLRLLSQSDLYSLSLCSSSAFDPCRRDDVVIPNIDRSVFNESAGSRKQTYSRLRLAPPSSSTSATPRRRTPHLRAAAAFANVNSNNSDPENAENAQIVTLLKQLFVTDVNYEELVPVKIDYSHTIPPQQFPTLPPSSPANVGPTGLKRKRGRPRKNELLGSEGESAMETSVIDVNEADGFSSLNEIFVREHEEDKDREILNKDGVTVDLVALGAVEHPYWEEIGRRTQGMGTEEELLGFLKGLNGEWGSRRKKKRIVDANEFGIVLPMGWKLLLSVKKKNGHVWLYCRRYISPGGLHFVSCKGVSSYLLSLHGVQDTIPYSSAQYNTIADGADKLTSVTIADPVQDDNTKENLVSHESSPTFGSTSGNRETQVIVNASDLPQDRIGEVLHCMKCNITFSEKDELLQHQSSLHRRNRYKSGTRITDGVIIKDGKYECQFCHKTFSERHRYNGHVGTHVRYQAKTVGESPDVSVNPSSHGEFPVRDEVMKGSLKSYNDVEICNPIADNGLNICPPCNKGDDHVGLKEANGNLTGVDEATVVVTERTPCSVAEVPFSSSEHKSFHEDERVNSCAVEINDDGSSLQERSPGSCSSLPLDDATHCIINGSAIENSAPIGKAKESMASKSSLLDSDDPVKECDIAVKNDRVCESRNDLKLDSENFAVSGSIFDFFGSHGDQDRDLAARLKQQSNSESMPCKNIGARATDNTSTSGSMPSELNKDSNISMLPLAQDEKACSEGNVTWSIGKHIETCENGSSETGNDGMNMQMQFGYGSVIPSWNKQENVSKKDDTEALTCVLEPGVHDISKSRFALSGHQSMYGYHNNSEEVCRRKMEVPEFDDFGNVGSGESSYPFNSNPAGLNSSSMEGTEQDGKLEVCPGFTSATDKQFFTEDNMISIFGNALEEHKQDPSGGILLGRSGVSEVCHEEYTLNKIYNTPANPSRLSEIEDTGKHDLSLSFGNLQTELCTGSNRVEQERYQADSVNLHSVVHKTHGDQTHFNVINSSISGDLKQGRPFGIDFHDSSFNNRTPELDTGFNMANLGRNWNGPPGDKMETSAQNIMAGFGNSSSQSGSWRTGHENVFRGSFDAPSGPQIPSSSCFHGFGLTSDKGEESSFGVNKNYNIHTDMLRPGRSEPVEYSFMGEESSNSLAGESKIFSYSSNMEQGLDPSFWLRNDALMPNASQTNQVTSVCVWCRNVFFHDPVQVGIQTGAIGTMCPSCSSRIPGQFNVL